MTGQQVEGLQTDGRTNKPTNRLTQTDTDRDRQSDIQMDHRVKRSSWILNDVLRWIYAQRKHDHDAGFIVSSLQPKVAYRMEIGSKT